MKIILLTLSLLSTPGLSDLIDDPTAPPPVSEPNSPAPPTQSSPTSQSSSPTRPKEEGALEGKGKSPTNKKAKKAPPVLFRSETMSGNRDKGVLVLKGSVKITQGDLIMMSDEAVIDQDVALGTLKTIVATGNVYFQKTDEATGKKMTATSQTANYSARAKTIVFKGKASITRGTDRINGTIFTYDMVSGLIKAQKVDGVFEQNE